jgi:hypothetical protein
MLMVAEAMFCAVLVMRLPGMGTMHEELLGTWQKQ